MHEQELAEKLFNIINTRELDKVDEITTDKTVFYFPGTEPILGTVKIKRFFRVLFRQYPRLTFTIKEFIIDKNKIAIEWTNEGIHKNGKAYDNQGVTILKIENAKISFLSDYFKDTSKFMS